MRSLVLAAPVVCLAVLASPAYPATAAPLVVNSAYAEDGVLFIQGGQFGDVPPYVTLAGVPLVVLSFNRTEIQAQLPDPTPPGSYLLLVARNPLRLPFYLFDVTIGAAGPEATRVRREIAARPASRDLQGLPALRARTSRADYGPAGAGRGSHEPCRRTRSQARARLSVGQRHRRLGREPLRERRHRQHRGPVNGLGNVVIGYNELRGAGDDRSGSHNLVFGSRNNYSSYGGLRRRAAGGNHDALLDLDGRHRLGSRRRRDFRSIRAATSMSWRARSLRCARARSWTLERIATSSSGPAAPQHRIIGHDDIKGSTSTQLKERS